METFHRTTREMQRENKAEMTRPCLTDQVKRWYDMLQNYYKAQFKFLKITQSLHIKLQQQQQRQQQQKKEKKNENASPNTKLVENWLNIKRKSTRNWRREYPKLNP